MKEFLYVILFFVFISCISFLINGNIQDYQGNDYYELNVMKGW